MSAFTHCHLPRRPSSRNAVLRRAALLSICTCLLLGSTTVPAADEPPPGANAAVLKALAVQNFDKVEVQKFPWGWIRWLMNDQLVPEAKMTLGVVHVNAGQSNPMHVHPKCEEVLYVVSGSCEHRVGEKTVVLKTGDVLRIPAGVPHTARTFEKEPMRAIVVYNCGKRGFEVIEEKTE